MKAYNNNILYIDFGSTVTRFKYNHQKIALDTTVPYNFIFKDEYLSVDKLFENIKRDWVSCEVNQLAVIKYFQHIQSKYKICNVLKIKASYPTTFNQSKKQGYKAILSLVFNVETKDIELISEANALLRGSKLANSRKNVVAADVGGYTTDIFVSKKNLNVKGFEIGGELITDKIAHALYDNKLSQVVDMVKAKELKEAHFKHGKLASLKVMESIVLNNATDKLISFDEIFDIVDEAFDSIYYQIANHIKSFSNSQDLIYIFGGVADIDRFQEIIKEHLGVSVQFTNDTFILINGLMADEQCNTVEVLANDLFLECKYFNEKHYIKVGQAGMPFPIFTKFQTGVYRADKKFVYLNDPVLAEKRTIPLYKGEEEEVYAEISLQKLPENNQVMNVTITINKDSVEIKNEEIVLIEDNDIKAVEFQEKIEKQAATIYNEELKRRNSILKERINKFSLEDLDINDMKFFTKVKESLMGVLLNDASSVVVPVPIVKESILTTKSVDEFLKYFKDQDKYVQKYFVIDNIVQQNSNIIVQLLQLIGLLEKPIIFTGSQFEQKYFKAITTTEPNDKLYMIKKELYNYYNNYQKKEQ